MNNEFSKDVDKGLSNTPKSLSSKYFYDETGDELFVQIMNMPEYYLTKAEHEIFKQQSDQIIEKLQLKKDTYFELIELGAGDGTKTKELLKKLSKHNYQFDYLPIDISKHALEGLENSLKTELPDVSVKPQQGDYFGVLSEIKTSPYPKVILFLGSNLGNLLDREANEFMTRLAANLSVGDKVCLGVDAIKSAEVVLPAYNDKTKITAKFNLNLLARINRELDANFDLRHFEHRPEYTEEEGVARSYLVSKKTQSVTIKSINKTIEFSEGERIHTEISRKYNDDVIKQILNHTDLEVIDKLTDTRNYFTDFILDKK